MVFRPLISISDYNIVINAFFSGVISPLLPQGLEVVLTGEEVGIRDLMSDATADALERWEEWCNKSAPTSHPNDEERWFTFLCLAAGEDREFASSDLEKWLVEDKEWPLGFSEEIEELCLEYDNAIRLLKYYRNHYENR